MEIEQTDPMTQLQEELKDLERRSRQAEKDHDRALGKLEAYELFEPILTRILWRTVISICIALMLGFWLGTKT